jgi:hypothetical protein
MFIFDVETLGVESTSVVLSAALIHFDPNDEPDYQTLLDSAIYVKFNAKEQIQNLKRSVDSDTLAWWKKQHEYVRGLALDPKPDDLPAAEGIQYLRDYVRKFPGWDKQTMWARGSLDQLVIDSLAGKLDLDAITNYNMWRDVRTAVDLLYGSTNGYCEVDHPTFNRAAVIKHHPVHDCALDAMMLMYGKAV